MAAAMATMFQAGPTTRTITALISTMWTAACPRMGNLEDGLAVIGALTDVFTDAGSARHS